jgi:hypothetical protein
VVAREEHEDVEEDVERDVERVPASGSCARCGSALDLASLKVGDRWYCSPTCAHGSPTSAGDAGTAVPETWLYSRPRRYFRARAPKELKRR